MQKSSFSQTVEDILQKNTRYQPQAYFFVHDAMDHTIKKFQRLHARDQNTHLSAEELLNGLRECTLKEFGPMGKLVLNEWGLHSCVDFGQIVFELVEHGVLGKKETDTLEDFDGHWSFDDAFVAPFLPRKMRKTTRNLIKRHTTLPKRPLQSSSSVKSQAKSSSNPIA